MMLFVASVMTIGEMRSLTTPKPLKKPVDEADADRRGGGRHDIGILAVANTGEDDRGRGQHPGDRKIDAAGQHDDGLADRRKAKERRELQQLQDIGRRGEARGQPLATKIRMSEKTTEAARRGGAPALARTGEAEGVSIGGSPRETVMSAPPLSSAANRASRRCRPRPAGSRRR